MLELVTVIKLAEFQIISVYIKEVFQQPTPLRDSTVHRVQEVVTSASIHLQINHFLSFVNLKHMASKFRRSDEWMRSQITKRLFATESDSLYYAIIITRESGNILLA